MSDEIDYVGLFGMFEMERAAAAITDRCLAAGTWTVMFRPEEFVVGSTEYHGFLELLHGTFFRNVAKVVGGNPRSRAGYDFRDSGGEGLIRCGKGQFVVCSEFVKRVNSRLPVPMPYDMNTEW